MGSGGWIPTQFSDNDDQSSGNGIQFNVLVSPYDIPEAVRGNRRESDGRFVIQFRYIDDGERPDTRKLKLTRHISVQMGKRSVRLYAIECDIDAMDVDMVGVQLLLPKVEEAVKETFKSLLEKPDKFPEMNNYESAQKVVRNRLDKLVGIPLAS